MTCFSLTLWWLLHLKCLVQKWHKWHLMKFSTLTKLSFLSLHNFWENLAFHTKSHCFCTKQKWHKRILIKFSSPPTLSSLSLHNPWENLALHKLLKLFLHWTLHLMNKFSYILINSNTGKTYLNFHWRTLFIASRIKAYVN